MQAQQEVVNKFQQRIKDPLFPCVGAKSALSHDDIEFVVGGDLRSPADDSRIVLALQAFAAAAPSDAVFVSKLMLFPNTPELGEVAFESAFWRRLQAFHDIDRADHAWDAHVSSDPASPEFSLSIGGRGFYVIGLHPGSSRPARRFECAAMAFNLHSQFEALRDAGRYEKLQEAITERDMTYSGSRNPMLAVHGASSEARQYSGRQVDAAWRCPFHAAPGDATDGP